MAKMSNSKARKRLEEAAMKVQRVYNENGGISFQMTLKICDELRKAAKRIK